MPISVRLDPALERRLVALSAQTGRTEAYHLRELVKHGLDDLEDYYRAAATAERVYKGEERVFSLDAVEQALGLAG